ncbi:carbonic anhydrase [Mycena capillaripes]|nr:carbonic anhydrase [Mycena capillaripes]
MSRNTPNAQELRARNAAWARKITLQDPDYFPTLAAEKQHPKVLWIGCADSRLSETTICNCMLGDIFTHRNIANMVSPTEDNTLAVIEYAIEHLHVEDIVVVGHTKCGGVEAAWLASRDAITPTKTPLERWLVPLIELSRFLGLNKLPLEDKEKALRILMEENVKRQVEYIASLPMYQEAKRVQILSLHSWVFHMETGTLVDVHASVPHHKL